MTSRIIGVIIVTASLAVLGTYAFFGNRASAQPSPVAVAAVPADGTAHPYTRTALCIDNGVPMRNWSFANRWLLNQLAHDTYVVDGRVFQVLRRVTNDSTLPAGNVRSRKVRINTSDGPVLEGHSYLRTLINGAQAKVERELLFVEFNGQLERQRRPLPACGTPRK